MIELYVLNKDLERIGIIDTWKSLIWANRYNEIGDCELYIPATTTAFNLLKKGYYLQRDDDEMVCRIEKIELDTDIESGDYLIITGYDTKKILSQRVIWNQINFDGYVEDYIRKIVNKNLVNPDLSARQIKNASGRANFLLGDKANFKDVITQQTTYDNVSDKVQELCKQYEWGYKVTVDDSTKNFYFKLYEGTDRSNYVIFSYNFENLLTTKYSEDSSNLANVSLVAGEGEGSARARNVSGYAESTDRNEIYVDAKDISQTINWEELTEMYPTTAKGGYGSVYTSGEKYYYKMSQIDIQIVDNNQLVELKANYPSGQIITKNSNRYYRITDVIIADLQSASPSDNDDVVLRNVVYEVYLLTRGYEKIAEYGSKFSFEGTVSPNITFIYKTDYNIGDLVTVENEYGISAIARIVEVVETYDDNGYSIEPKFEYTELIVDTNEYPISTENGIDITNEDGIVIVTEGVN